MQQTTPLQQSPVSIPLDLAYAICRTVWEHCIIFLGYPWKNTSPQISSVAPATLFIQNRLQPVLMYKRVGTLICIFNYNNNSYWRTEVIEYLY